MTAKITISSARREHVISIPQRAIIKRHGDTSVRMLDGNNVKEVNIETGLRGSDGYIEIVRGIREGDTIITFSEE